MATNGEMLLNTFFGEKCTRCKERRTSERFCDGCKVEIRAEQESKLQCPLDSAIMEKNISDSLITDKCPKCEGIFLNKEELEIIRRASSSGDDGFAAGMVVGGILF